MTTALASRFMKYSRCPPPRDGSGVLRRRLKRTALLRTGGAPVSAKKASLADDLHKNVRTAL